MLDDDQPICIPKRIPNELICDLFLALDRNEMEKCQLICKKWRLIVDEHSSILPLRKIPKLFLRAKPTRRTFPFTPIATFQVDEYFNCSVLFPLEINGICQDDEQIARAKSLKYCVFNLCQIWIDMVRDQAPCEEAVKLLEKLTYVAGQKLRAIKIDHSKIAENKLEELKPYIEFDSCDNHH